MANLIYKILCVLTAIPTSHFCSLSPFLRPLYPLGHKDTAITQINPIMASKCSSKKKKKSHMSLNQKLEMITLSEEDLLKKKIGQKLGLLQTS